MTGHSEAVASLAGKATQKKIRDVRLDFFRGIGMLIILIAHIPYNDWALWIPARFGFSDATEMFVFQSGMASAIAFGAAYDRGGTVALLARVTQRIWQIYWAHICVFVIVVSVMAVAGTGPDGTSYLESLNLLPFVRNPASLLAALLTLRYVPNYFDILPMYIVILALLPLMLAVSRLHQTLPFIIMAALWIGAQTGLASFPAEPWSDRQWFFDPFGWQLIFFTGFFLMRGILPKPRHDRRLLILCLGLIILTVPFAWVRFFEMHPFFQTVADHLKPLTDKTSFGFLRFVHFLALCYVAVFLVGENGSRLRGPVVKVLVVVGQQSLAVFVAGMVLAQILGIFLDRFGRGVLAEAVANLVGFSLLIATAYLVRWYKTSPWKS